MITAQTDRLIAIQINSRRFEEVRASWYFLLIVAIPDSVIHYSFRQRMGKQLSILIQRCKRCATLNLTKINQC